MKPPSGDSRDEDLVAAIRRGNSGAADLLVRRHYRAAFAIALALLGNRMDAEDVCQEGFVRALQRIDDCRDPARFVFWLFQIIRNRAHNAREHRELRRGPSLDETEDVPADAPGGGAAAGVERRELADRLEAELAHLNELQRQVVLLKDLEGWDHRAIAAALGISEGMSRQHLFAARRLLRERLGGPALEEYLDER